MKLKILATGGYCETLVGDDPPELKALVRESTGAAPRRVTRFVQLALIGAGRCAQQRELPPDTAVYFASCRGDVEVTSTLLDDLVRRRELPSPLTFVNSVSNAACFFVASVLGLNGRSNFVTNRYDPLVAAAKSAWADFARGEVQTALIGTVDACSRPVADHRQRLGVGAADPLGEASHWLLLAAQNDPRPALATLSAVANFPDFDQMMRWLHARALPAATRLAPGQHLSEAALDRIMSECGFSQVFDYRRNLPYYDSQTGAALDFFIAEESGQSRVLLHINSDPDGRYSLLILES